MLIVEISSVNGIDVEFRLDYIQFTEMPSTLAVGTDTRLGIVMAKVCFKQLSLSLVEVLVVESAVRLSFLDTLSCGRHRPGGKLHVVLVVVAVEVVACFARRIHQSVGSSNILRGVVQGGIGVCLLNLIQLAGACVGCLFVGVHEGVLSNPRQVRLLVGCRASLGCHPNNFNKRVRPTGIYPSSGNTLRALE